jgi:2'-5' RNA ligase
VKKDFLTLEDQRVFEPKAFIKKKSENTARIIMQEAIRGFIAFDIESHEVLKKLADAQGLLLKTGADLKPVEPQNIHVTVRFLGNISSEAVEKIFEEMKKVQFVAFDIRIQGVGAFPNVKYPRVVWAGIKEGADQLRSIFSQLEPRLHGLGFAPDARGFSPHLTIARVRSGRGKVQLAQCITENANFEFGVIKGQCLKLKRSNLTPKGPVYSTLREFCP